MRGRFAALCTAVLTLAGAAFAADPGRSPVNFRDTFNDATTRSGPSMVAVPVTEADVGAGATEVGASAYELRHHVFVSPYAIGTDEVTNAEFCAFLNDRGNAKDDGVDRFDPAATNEIVLTNGHYAPAAGAERHPVAGVTWRGARAYAAWLSQRTGAAYDLPTAAQWEIAARAGTPTTWWWGDADDPARYRSIASGAAGVADTGSYGANPWGVRDTAGNVWEWTLDCFIGDAALLTASHDPVVFDERCLTPEIRGGSFADGGVYARPSYRGNSWWSAKRAQLGFRVARRMAAPDAQTAVAFRWQHSGKPATVTTARNGSTTRVIDPASGVVVFEGTLPAGGSVSLPEPVRIRGTIAGAVAGSPVTVRVGSGPRAAPMERWYRATGSEAPRDGRMTSAFGIALPPSPLQWNRAAMEGTRFTSGWLVATDAPQIVAFDTAGRAVVQDIALPAGIDAHATVDVGALALAAMPALDVDAARPIGGDALAPLDLAVTAVTVTDAARADAGRFLGALDQIDPRLFALFVTGPGISLPLGGNEHLAPLPPLSSVTLVSREPIAGEPSTNSVPLAAGTNATLHLGLDAAGSFRTAATMTLHGRVSLPFRRGPIAGATVVVNDYPRRIEGVTAADGTFAIEGVRGDRPVDVLIDASKSRGIPPGYAATQLFRGVVPATNADIVFVPPETVASSMPVFSLATPLLDQKCMSVNDDQYPTIIGAHDSAYDPAFVLVSQKDNDITFAACTEATWNVWGAMNPFLVAIGSGDIREPVPLDKQDICPGSCIDHCFTGTIAIQPVQAPLAKIVLQINRTTTSGSDISVGAGTSVIFSPPDPFSADLDPITLQTNSEGQIVLCDINTSPVHVVIGDTFECDVNLATLCTLTIGRACNAVTCSGGNP